MLRITLINKRLILWSKNMDLRIVTKYLDEYEGKEYQNPEKFSESQNKEKEYFIKFRNNGRAAREEFRKYCNMVCASIPELEMHSRSPSGWINQGRIVYDYFWSRFKLSKYDSYVNNISITINRERAISESRTLGVYIGLDNNNADSATKKRQMQLLDLEIENSKNFYYLMTYYNDKNYVTKNINDVRDAYNSNKLKVVSFLKVIDGPYTADRADIILEDTKNAILEFIPYYEYIMDVEYKDSRKSDEAEDKSGNVSNKNVNEYSLGCGVYHKKFGYGTIVDIGAELVTIDFESYGEKKLVIEACEKGNLLSII